MVMAIATSKSSEGPATPSKNVSPEAARTPNNNHSTTSSQAANGVNEITDNVHGTIYVAETGHNGASTSKTSADHGHGVVSRELARDWQEAHVDSTLAHDITLAVGTMPLSFLPASAFRTASLYPTTVQEMRDAYKNKKFNHAEDGTFLSCFLVLYGEVGEVNVRLRGKLLNSIQALETFELLPSAGSVYIGVSDIRDSWAIIRYIRDVKDKLARESGPTPELHVQCLGLDAWDNGRLQDPSETRFLESSLTYQTNWHGQVLLQARLMFVPDNSGVPNELIQQEAANAVFDFLSPFTAGINVFVHRTDHHNQPTMMFHVGMNVHIMADKVVDELGGSPNGYTYEFGNHKFSLWATYYSDEIEKSPYNATPTSDPAMLAFRCRWWGNEMGMATPKTPRHAQLAAPMTNGFGSSHGAIGEPSPLAGSQVPSTSRGLWDRGMSYNRFTTPQNFASRIGSFSHRNRRNQVDMEAIVNGSDVRTTLMLRNIPNSWNHYDLKHLIDVDLNFVGLYDFLYLRVDFTTGFNVGYAFINIVSPHLVGAFVQGFRGKLFPESDKVAEVSYATNQGVEALMDKFRNSAVMEKQENFRPQLYYTFPHPDAGKPKPFPKPDNLIKLSRSEANAESIGLYGPRRPQLGHDARGRRGMYDRGHPGARQDELEYENRVLRELLTGITL